MVLLHSGLEGLEPAASQLFTSEEFILDLLEMM